MADGVNANERAFPADIAKRTYWPDPRADRHMTMTPKIKDRGERLMADIRDIARGGRNG